MAATRLSTQDVRDASLTDADIAAANKDGAKATPSMRTLSASAPAAIGTAAAGSSQVASSSDHVHAGAHSSLTGITANDHHNRSHDHSASGDGTALRPVLVNLIGGQLISGIDANQNNFNPSGLHTCTVLKFNALTAARTITGLDAGADGDILWIVNATGNNLILAYESASSSALNRFSTPGLAAFTIRGGGGVAIYYSNTRWVVLSP